MKSKQKSVSKAVKRNPKVVKAEKKVNYSFFIGASVIGILTGLIFAINLKWVGDDIYIPLRYIEHMLAGDGLVYNIGERVEGYTDFLWVMIIALFQYLKFDPVETSLNLGLLFSAGIMVTVTFISFKLNVARGMKYFIPLSLFLLALNYDYAVWQTSGLETMLYTFLLVASFGVYFFTDIKRNKRLFVSGLLLCFALLTRPDAALFIGLVNLFLLIRNIILKTHFKKLVIEQLLFCLAIVLIYIPYFIWRYHYYGQIFPNTYYSKAGYLSFYSRGFYYLWLYCQVHFTTFLFFLSVPVLFKTFFSSSGDSKLESFRNSVLSIINNRQLSAFIVAVTCVTLYLVFFVAKVGGDFMYARFVMPCLPFIVFVIEYSLHDLQVFRYKQRYAFITVALLALVVVESNTRVDFFLVEENGKDVAKEKKGIADERYVYVNQYKLSYDKKVGMALQPYFKGLDATVLVRGGQACFVYYAKFKTCIEDHGLTDTVISHLPIKERGGKIGHEKSAPYEYMIKRGVNFVFRRSLYKQDQYRLCQFSVDGVGDRAEIICYDRKLIKALKERMGADFMYTDFEAYLDNYIHNVLPLKSKEDLRKDYEDFKNYYFLHNDDKERESQFLSKLS